MGSTDEDGVNLASSAAQISVCVRPHYCRSLTPVRFSLFFVQKGFVVCAVPKTAADFCS